MSLFSTLHVGRSGLSVNQTGLQVTGDNIANVNTIGYRASRAAFRDLLMRDIPGHRGQIGGGATVAGIGQVFTQGALESTGVNTDLAILGQGFFVMEDATGQRAYSRAGQFDVDNEGYLRSLSGETLMGYLADSTGNVGTSLAQLQISREDIAPQPTTNVAVTGNLDATAAEIDPALLWSNGNLPATYDDATGQFTSSTSMQVYDPQGEAHEVVIYFQKTGANSWDWYSAVDQGETGGTAGNLAFIGSGSLTFDAEGALSAATPGALPGQVAFDGTAPQTLTFDFGAEAGAVGVSGGRLHQYAGLPHVDSRAVDGRDSGALTGWYTSGDGTITGTYDNGQTVVLGQVAVAEFDDQEALRRVGQNRWVETKASGVARIASPTTGSRGTVEGGHLEQSSVDLEQEFVDMITYQRAYQASARVVTVSDQMLRELVNLL